MRLETLLRCVLLFLLSTQEDLSGHPPAILPPPPHTHTSIQTANIGACGHLRTHTFGGFPRVCGGQALGELVTALQGFGVLVCRSTAAAWTVESGWTVDRHRLPWVRFCAISICWRRWVGVLLANWLFKVPLWPLTSKYTYLGCVINRSLSLVMVADRAAKGRRALMALQPFLRNSAVPLALHVRAAVFRGTVPQSCLYGAELWGGSLQRVRPAQRVVSSGLRHLVGCGLDSKLPAMFAVYRELHRPRLRRWRWRHGVELS